MFSNTNRIHKELGDDNKILEFGGISQIRGQIWWENRDSRSNRKREKKKIQKIKLTVNQHWSKGDIKRRTLYHKRENSGELIKNPPKIYSSNQTLTKPWMYGENSYYPIVNA